jgi:hypothetical protein
MIKKIIYMILFSNLIILFACTPAPPTSSPANEPKVVTVKGLFNTTASNGSGGQGINIDAQGGAVLHLGKIKRYTLTIHTALLSRAPAGIDRIEIYVGVLEGGSAYSVRVFQQDPATASPFPHAGMTVLPYTGTNSHFKVFRGADGLGPVDVRFNAYVEVEP